MKKLLFIIYLITGKAAAGQFDLGKITDSLFKKNVKSWIYYAKQCECIYPGDSYKYLLWPQDSVTRLMTITTSNYNPDRSVFKTVSIPSDSLFSYIDSNFDSVRCEQLMPFVFFEKASNGDSIYEIPDGTHPAYINLMLSHKMKECQFRNLAYNIEPDFHGQWANLNFKFNSSTRLYFIIKSVQQLVERFHTPAE